MTDRIRNAIDRTLFELWCGILAYGILALIIIGTGLFIFRPEDPISYPAGLLIGILCALVYAWHLWKSIDGALGLDTEAATKKMRLNYILRYTAALLVLALSALSGRISVLTVFAGIIGVKIGAYLNRPMKKISDRIYGEEPPYVPEESTGEEEGNDIPADDREAAGNLI
ncbi:MAG: ATP synthase subunit I [Lachnospiraceae bacterium]|nr:ATP synthase subunit I [Lachnospiraceae bacterium]